MMRTQMASAERSILREGIVAGLIGAAVVAVWFLAFDIVRGQPFLTPGLLGAAVFHGVTDPAGLKPTLGNVLGYTIIHGLAFVAFGVVAASLMAVSEREPALFLAFVILFASFEVFVFGVVGALGKSMLGALVWWAILIGNLLASIAMLWYFFRAHRALPRTLIGSWGAVLREGIVAGLLGAAVVALWFLAIDWIQGEPLRTPTLLGMGLLRQSDPVTALVTYTVLHGIAFALFGIIGALLIAGAERQPLFVFALVIFFTAFEVFFIGGVLIAAKWVLDEIAGWTVFVGNLLASVVMLAYFFRGHRGLGSAVDGCLGGRGLAEAGAREAGGGWGHCDHAARGRISRRGWAPSGRVSSAATWRNESQCPPPHRLPPAPPVSLVVCLIARRLAS